MPPSGTREVRPRGLVRSRLFYRHPVNLQSGPELDHQLRPPGSRFLTTPCPPTFSRYVTIPRECHLLTRYRNRLMPGPTSLPTQRGCVIVRWACREITSAQDKCVRWRASHDPGSRPTVDPFDGLYCAAKGAHRSPRVSGAYPGHPTWDAAHSAGRLGLRYRVIKTFYMCPIAGSRTPSNDRLAAIGTHNFRPLARPVF